MDWYSKIFKGAGAKVGYTYGVIGTVATILTVGGEIILPIKVVAILGLSGLALVIFCVMSFINCKRILKETKQYYVDTFEPRAEKVYLYITYVPDIRPGALCTLYAKINGRVKRFGYGIAENYVENEYVEIRILDVKKEFSDLYSRAQKNDKTVIKEMYILPRIYEENIVDLYEILRGDYNENEDKTQKL